MVPVTPKSVECLRNIIASLVGNHNVRYFIAVWVAHGSLDVALSYV